MNYSALLKILAAILLAIVAGLLTSEQTAILGVPLIKIYGLIRELFLNSLQLVMIPLVASSIIVGVSRMGGDQSIGRLGGKAFAFFGLTTTLAVLVGWGLAFTLHPGSGSLSSTSLPPLTLSQSGEISLFSKVRDILLQIFPKNIFDAASKGQMLSVIFFSLLFGFFTTKVEKEVAPTLQLFWKGVFQVMMSITQLIIKVLPIGVFGMVAYVIATTGHASLTGAGMFFFSVVTALAIFVFVALPVLLYTVARVNPWLHLKAMAPALLTAVTTSSSAATLPMTLECVEKRVGLSNRIASFAVPIGTSMNMAGSALFIIMTVLYVTQAYQIELTFVEHFTIIFMTILMSFGIAGVPSASLLSAIVVLEMIGVPSQGIGLVVIVDRLLDMFRAPSNVFTCSCSAVLIASAEGEVPAFSFKQKEQLAS